jgi:hypothetical protein
VARKYENPIKTVNLHLSSAFFATPVAPEEVDDKADEEVPEESVL